MSPIFCIPIAGIKGGLCFWRKPVNEEKKLYQLGNKLGYWLSQKYLLEFGYNFVKNNLRKKQKEWCNILGLKEYDFVLVGEIPKNHLLEKEHLHAGRYDKQESSTKLFSLVPYYENDIILKKFLKDNEKVW